MQLPWAPIPNSRKIRRLQQSIPGVGPQVSMHLLAIMKRHTFRCAEQLAAYLGLIPIERQSGSSVLGRARLSKAGPALILFTCTIFDGALARYFRDVAGR